MLKIRKLKQVCVCVGAAGAVCLDTVMLCQRRHVDGGAKRVSARSGQSRGVAGGGGGTKVKRINNAIIVQCQNEILFNEASLKICQKSRARAGAGAVPVPCRDAAAAAAGAGKPKAVSYPYPA